MHTSTKKSKLLAAVQALRQDFEAAVLREIEAHPEWPYWMVADRVGLSEASVLRIVKKNNMSRTVGPRPRVEISDKGGL
jgi:hypothetical protein